MLAQPDRRRLIDELRRLAETFDSIGHTDPELLWCELRVSVQRLRELLPADAERGEDEAVLKRFADFLDELWETCQLGSESGRIDLPSGERARGLVNWFREQFAKDRAGDPPTSP